MDTQPTIRQLVEKALYYRQITPEIAKGINELLVRLGYVSDVDYEAHALLLDQIDEVSITFGQLRYVP